jgi:hypothetical protein
MRCLNHHQITRLNKFDIGYVFICHLIKNFNFFKSHVIEWEENCHKEEIDFINVNKWKWKPQSWKILWANTILVVRFWLRICRVEYLWKQNSRHLLRDSPLNKKKHTSMNQLSFFWWVIFFFFVCIVFDSVSFFLKE